MAHKASDEQPVASSNHGAEFTVMIIASGPLRNGGLVHAVAVTQPVQSWTVLRSHDDFYAVSDVLSQLLPAVPACPMIQDVGSDVLSVVNARNELQKWLTAVLTHPGSTETLAVRNFLTYGANIILPQFEGVSWTSFNAEGAVVSPSAQQQEQQELGTAGDAASDSEYCVGNLDDMEMDMGEMFLADYEGVDLQDDEEEDDEYIRPSIRYKPTDEVITEEDMEMMHLASEVEMIEDIGSLAQSLGASHLGRSLQLQAEIATRDNMTQPPTQQEGGLTLGGAAIGNSGVGGIRSAIEGAVGLGEGLRSRPPESAPRLDSFKMIRVIGKGSFGKVFLVKEHKTGQMYALKVLRKDNIIKRNQVEHTKTERSVLGYVKHPFIVGMNMAFQSKDKLYFVLDFCAGGELFFHLGKLGKFPEERARFYAAEIVHAISYCHQLDIVYRDLKPENVLLTAEGHIRLTDFGLSKEGISSSSSGANSFCGTPEYLAPEILNRQGHGRAVDWWSLGALLYEMLTGLPPFYCQDRERLFEKIRKSELHYPPSVQRPAKMMLKGLLTKDPTLRLGSGPKDAEEIKCHEFFSVIDWDKLAQGEITPPWRPNITGTLDTSQFDKEFTNMPVFSPQSMQRMHSLGTTPADQHFEGFTFTDRILHGPGAQAGNPI